MIKLQEISQDHETAFFRMIGDYREHDTATLLAFFEQKDWDEKRFTAFLRQSEAGKQDWRPKAGRVSVTRYVLAGPDGKIYGNGMMRFPLDEKMEREGGNLVFDVPPSLRGQGWGAVTLNRMLFEAVRAGLARVLVSCPSDNAAARRSIEKNRGELDSDEGGIAKYWIRLR